LSETRARARKARQRINAKTDDKRAPDVFNFLTAWLCRIDDNGAILFYARTKPSSVGIMTYNVRHVSWKSHVTLLYVSVHRCPSYRLSDAIRIRRDERNPTNFRLWAGLGLLYYITDDSVSYTLFMRHGLQTFFIGIFCVLDFRNEKSLWNVSTHYNHCSRVVQSIFYVLDYEMTTVVIQITNTEYTL